MRNISVWKRNFYLREKKSIQKVINHLTREGEREKNTFKKTFHSASFYIFVIQLHYLHIFRWHANETVISSLVMGESCAVNS